MKKILSLLIVFCVISGMFGVVGCGNEIEIDQTKTQLYIGNYNGGIGTEWLKVLGAAFEESVKDESFQSGRQGVQIIVDNGKDQYVGEQVLSAMQSARQDVFFTQDIDYEYAAKNGYFADITDIVTEKFDTVDLGDGIKTYSIEDKMSDLSRDFFKIDGKYYALEYISAIRGIIFDVDLFCSKRLYFLKNGTINGSIDSPDDELAPGPDGIENTFDDGLPETWEQFKKLMAEMIRRGVTPFTWSGLYTYPREALFSTIWASYEGYNDYTLNNTFHGTTTGGVSIDETTAWKLAGQNGKLAAATAIYDIVSNPKNYSEKAFKTSQTHTGAEEEFLFSTTTSNPIAMLLEGAYWENEASGVFNDMVSFNGPQYARENRRFSYLPIPKFVGTDGVPDQVNQAATVSTDGMFLTFINAYTKKMELAKRFLQFIHSNEMLSKFNSITGVTKSFRYVMTKQDYEQMSYYQKTVYDIYRSSDVVNGQLVTARKRKENKSYFNYWSFQIKMSNGMVYTDPFVAFRDSIKEGGSLTAADWYGSYLNNYNSNTWK